jgi:hypothetical protein
MFHKRPCRFDCGVVYAKVCVEVYAHCETTKYLTNIYDLFTSILRLANVPESDSKEKNMECFKNAKGTTTRCPERQLNFAPAAWPIKILFRHIKW